MTAALAGRYALSLTDAQSPPDTRGLPFTRADMGDLGQIQALCQGVDTVVHLAASSDLTSTWEPILENNIIGLYNLFQAASDEEGGFLGLVGRIPQLETSAPRAGRVDEEGKRLLDERFRIVVQSELEQLAEEIALARQFSDLGVHVLGTLRQRPSEEKRSGRLLQAVESIRHRVRRVPCNGLNTSLIETAGSRDSRKNRVFAVSHLVA